MNLSGLLLKWAGWKVEVTAPDYEKCIICVAPHTSNWDFIIGKLAYQSVGRKAEFLMKESWFFFPLGCLFRAMGGIPVPRGKKKKAGVSLVEALVKRFNESKSMHVAITPEGTRKRTAKWRTGFLQIAYQANVPCILAVLDYSQKRIIVDQTFRATSDVDADMAYIKKYYSQFQGKHPEKFTTENA